MRIEVTRSGGFAGITRRAVVETDQRPDAADWLALARRADVPADPGEPPPDGFTWSIRLDTTHLVVADQVLDGPLRELAERALREARSPRPP